MTNRNRYTGHSLVKHILTMIVWLMLSVCSAAQTMEELFKHPPAAAKPKTWMHAMSGNMSAEGLTKDLESMAEVGLGGLLLFSITQGIPKGPVKYNSPQHISLLAHAAKEAKRLGLTFGVHNCDGWSSSGGPWILPEESMKMVVWSEKVILGGRPQTVTLPQPTTREGFYQDIALVAYPALPAEIADTVVPNITASDPSFNLSIATDKKWDKQASLTKTGTTNPWIEFRYNRPHTVSSATLFVTNRDGKATLLRSDDGINFTDEVPLQKVRTGKGEWVFSSHFPPVTARYFRFLFDETTTIKEASISSTYLINNPLGRTAMARTESAELAPIGRPAPAMIIGKDNIILLQRGTGNGDNISVNLPAGNWTVMRFGITSTGAFNNPASDEGRGLEVDKLNRPAFKKHYDAFVKKVVTAAGPAAVQYVEIDSYEMGGQNWTDSFDAVFRQRKGYDILSFLPLVAGKFVESAAVSEAVLEDFREVISDLMTENYFGYFQELCQRDGLKTYIENYGFGPLNDLDVGGKADLPMGEFWMARPITQVASPVSAAHIYGRNVISAESFTSTPEINWKGHPAMAKLSGDKAWALGVNEFMFHRFAHQANTHVQPGMTMNRWGFHMDRTQTWWKSAGAAWFKYIARGSYLLRQGVPVSDLLVFVGDGSPNGIVGRTDFPTPIPAGINFDCVNTDVLRHRVKTEGGELVLPEGTRYKALVLKNSTAIKLSTLQRLHQLAQQGIPVIGEKPQRLLGYNHSAKEKETFHQLVAEIWKGKRSYDTYEWSRILPSIGIKNDLCIKGRSDIAFMHRKTADRDIYFTYNPDSVAQDFELSIAVENKLPELWNPVTGEIEKSAQFVQENGYTKLQVQLEAEESVFIVFRKSADGVPSVHPASLNKRASYSLSDENKLLLTATDNGSVQARRNDGRTITANVEGLPAPMEIGGAWQVSFSASGGYGGTVNMLQLTDWKDNANDSIRYFAGTAVYKKTVVVPEAFGEKNRRALLDLGKVNIVARVVLNGTDLGVAWMPPFTMDITGALQAGTNALEIHVTNQWTNRLIGEERYPPQDGGYKLENQRPVGFMPAWYTENKALPPGPRTTFTTAPFYKKGDALEPSGLLGPVRIKALAKIKLEE